MDVIKPVLVVFECSKTLLGLNKINWIMLEKMKKKDGMDGMPILFLTPVLGLATFGAYVKFLFNRKIFLHFKKSNEVHLAFVPHIWGFNLKKNIQKKETPRKQ